ncbi:hypothetical protein D922_03082 [Enterococcus faecalis 06-MB-DW-09]|nr:hypothetical protein D922_03082 [Enterococcus faecalis 06-MB-DW-09]
MRLFSTDKNSSSTLKQSIPTDDQVFRFHFFCWKEWIFFVFKLGTIFYISK